MKLPRSATIFVAIVGSAGLCFVAIVSLLTFGRPPQPLPLGTVQWLGEAGVTVDRVERVSELTGGNDLLRPRGVFYIVHARVIAPFGLRPTWDDRDVEVRTFAGTGGTQPEARFGVDEVAQAVLDRKTGRPGSSHLVLGAEQHEDLVFDLPRDVEQPAVVFLQANDATGLIGFVFGQFWQPHRFNIRYD